MKLVSAALCLVPLLLNNSAEAANAYWDINGTAAGSGGGAPSGLWEDPNWASVTGGTSATANWVDVAAGNFPRFAAASDANGSYTITANADHIIAGMLRSGGTNGAVLTISGTGVLTIGGGVQQGFFAQANCFIRINNKLSGTGGVICQSGQLYLDGNNDYSGGTTPAPGLINFNNANSFGTGPLLISASGGALIPEGTSAINITNAWTVSVNASLNCVGLAAGITYSGPIALGANTLTLGCGGGTTALDIFSGVISGTGGIGRQSSASHGVVRVTGANTYTGKTLLQSSVTSVSSLNSVTTPAQQPSSNLGVPSSVANGTLGIGATTFTGTLLYTGAGETTDRVIDLAGTTGGATLQADGTGPLVFTSVNTATGAGAKTLTLQGSNTDANSIGKIVNSTLATAVVKAQAGRWVLTGANTYTGGTTVNGGSLEISGSVLGNVTVNSGTLTFSNASAMVASATLAVSSGTTVNLNYTGTNAVNALLIDGGPQISGVWGPIGSTAPNQSALLAGTGFINVLGKPAITQQPVSGSVFPDALFTFSVGVGGDLSSLTYQWKQNGVNIAGATDSSYTIFPAEAPNAGAYSCWVTNAFGWTNTLDATLYVLGTNAYTQTIRGDNPISYWRLDETNGVFAFDAISGNNGQYRNVLLKQSGYSLTDADPAIALPANTNAGRGYVSVTNFAPFAFLGIPAFSLESWAYFTNLTGVQRIFSTFALTGSHGWAFGINGNSGLRFTSGTHQDADMPLSTPLVTGTWYHLVCTCDGSSYYFYLNGDFIGSVVASIGNDGTAQPLTIGCNPVAYTNNTAGDPLSEQVRGRLDELAIYNNQLSAVQVTNHYLARYADAPAPVASLPIVNPPTNYVSLTTTLQESAAGVNLNYQWVKIPSGPIAGATSSSLALSPLQSSDAGDYYVVVSNTSGSTNSPTNHVYVLAIPTNASQLNLTNGLVLHLPFDSNYSDISGRGNNGTNVGATTLVSSAAVGTNALHYGSTNTSSSYNYVTLGVRPDLQFGASTDFTVAYWIRQPAGSTYTNLPFFTDALVGAGTGFSFSPYQTATTAGGWLLNIGTMSSPSAFTSFPDADLINDGNWHHLVHSASRAANITTYLDGKQVDSQAIGFLGNINTANPATIGQDPSGTYAVTAEADIDDLAVWQRTLTPLEVSGIYLAGATNGVSFAPAVSAPIVPQALQVDLVSGQVRISWPGVGGTLQASGIVTGTYTNVPGATSPYFVPASAGDQLFYRLKY